MQKTKTIAACGMTAALSVVVMILGAALGLGMYASPMIAGFCLIPIGENHGRKYQWTLWIAVSLLCLILIPEIEQNLMYITLFGLYPLLHPLFEKLPKRLKWPLKLLYFNVTVIAVEALVMLVLVPEIMGVWMGAALLLMGNFVFICYDFLIPRAGLIMQRYLHRIQRR